ncbi:MAG: hypothetical protein IKP28_05740 [Clostridia bacterium]|nr:hypothetical protein [Clostridia bacterium]
MNKKGITLVALVTTVIILLILSGTAIAIAIGGNGLFEKANNTTEKWNASTRREENSVDEVLEKINGLKIMMATEKLFVNTSNPDATDAEKSPYVNYVDKNGNTILCRVLYDSSSPYGIEIIAENYVDSVTIGKTDPSVSASDFQFSGNPSPLHDTAKRELASYNRYITTLNEKASDYLDTNGIADRARCVGSNPANPTDTATMYTSSNTFLTNNGWNGVFKSGDNNKATDVTQMKNLGIFKKNYEYWLASRYVSNYIGTPPVNGDAVDLSCAYVASNSESSNSNYLIFTIWYSSSGPLPSSEEPHSYKLRPVFHLTEQVKIVSGNGTAESPYNLGI